MVDMQRVGRRALYASGLRPVVTITWLPDLGKLRPAVEILDSLRYVFFRSCSTSRAPCNTAMIVNGALAGSYAMRYE